MRIIQGVFGFGSGRNFRVQKDAQTGKWTVLDANNQIKKRFDNQMEANAYMNKKNRSAKFKRNLATGAGIAAGVGAVGAGAAAAGLGYGIHKLATRPQKPKPVGSKV